MATPFWNPGTLYQPGALVQPRSASQVTQTPPNNPSFETAGLAHWAASYEFGTGTFSVLSAPPPDMSPNAGAFDGTKFLSFIADPAGSGPRSSVYGLLKNDYLAPVRPGQSINFSVRIARNSSPHSSSWSNGGARIYWYDITETLIDFSVATTSGTSETPDGMTGGDDSGVAWKLNSGSAIAPPNAAYAQAAIILTDNTAGGSGIWADDFRWDYTFQGFPDGLIFRATQAVAGFSGASEPVWPIISGGTVVDNEVTWEGVFASRVVWEASPVLVSGASEPTWPLFPGGTIPDGASPTAIAWVAMDWRVKDPKCPQSKIVAIAVSKIFAADEDIVAYSATTNPLDWATEGDAGYLPFGLQSYGAQAVEALGLYRGNLLPFNAQGYQMWQVDEDPANMALLDAQPVGCEYHKSLQPVSNDLVMLTQQGIRNIGIAGASTNLQAGFFGKAIDPLVQLKVIAGLTPRGLYWPGAGQYWCFFGAECFVLTMNGGPSDMSWSRYVFPSTVDAWTIHEGLLILRSGELVWEVSAEAEGEDDLYCDASPPLLIGSLDDLTAELSWTAASSPVSPITGYRIYNAATDALLFDTMDPDILAHDFTGLDESTEYSYYVRAYTVFGESENSNVVVLNTGFPMAPLLSGIIGGDDDTDAEMTWTEAETTGGPITGYRLYNAVTHALIVDINALLYTVADLATDTTYSFYVTSYTALSESEPSNIVILDTGHPGVITEIYSTPGEYTWTKRAFLVSVSVSKCIGGGAGGASGGIGSAERTRRGGMGGGGGGASTATILAGALASTVTVTVGAGGAGGPAVSGANTNGVDGSNGGASSFGAHCTANGGTGGRRGVVAGGGSVPAGGGEGGTGTLATGGAGGASGAGIFGSFATAGGTSTRGGGGGGGGGSRSSGANASDASNGGNGDTSGTTQNGGAFGPAGTDGSAGESATDAAGGGGGGGGQYVYPTFATFGDGGPGGTFGGGGGGGGGGDNAGPSGSGGSGRGGYVVVVSTLS